MNKMYEEDGGVGQVSNVTQVSNMAPGQKIDVFGTKDKDVDNWYEQLLELKDYTNLKENDIDKKDRTLFAGFVSSLINSFEKNIKSEFFSDHDKEFYQVLIDELKEFPQDKSVTIIRTTKGVKYIFSSDAKE